MDHFRFDAWTRRGLGLAVGGGLVSLLGLSGIDESAAKKKRKRRCRRLKQACQPGNRNKRCCKTLTCGAMPDLGDHHCCRPLRGLCEEESDCCGLVDHACTDNNDCCGNLSCRQERGKCEGK